jgi:hypothetical protein
MFMDVRVCPVLGNLLSATNKPVGERFGKMPRLEIQEEELLSLMRGYGWMPYMVAGHDIESMHQAMAATVEMCVNELLRYQKEARYSGKASTPR